jgi:hypothetical protein
VVDALYGALANHVSYATALQVSKLEARRASRHPYYRATLVLTVPDLTDLRR